jgi:hypothetical protein
LGFGAYGTAKAGSGMPAPLVMMREMATKERNYGKIIDTIGRDGKINYITFIDQGAV